MSSSPGPRNPPQRQPDARPAAVGAVTIRRLQAQEWPAYRQLRLRSLADAPYAFGSTLAAEEAWRPEIWMARLTAAASSGRDCPLVAEAGADAAFDTDAGVGADAAAAAGVGAAADARAGVGVGVGANVDVDAVARADGAADADAGAGSDAARTMLGLVYAKCDAEEADVVNLFQMWVAPEARGRGVAVALLRDAIGWARSIGARTVRLGVVEGNEAAARLYAREGFRDLGAPVPMRPGSAVLEQTMQLEIAAQAHEAAAQDAAA